MSIADAIQRAHSNDGIITSDEFTPIYDEVMASIPERPGEDFFLTAENFRALTEGRFNDDSTRTSFYQGLLIRERNRTLRALERYVETIQPRERYSILENFTETNGQVVGRLQEGTRTLSPNLRGDAAGVFIILALVLRVDPTVPGTPSRTPLGNLLHNFFGPSPSYYLIGPPEAGVATQIIDGHYFTADSLTAGRLSLPAETRITFAQIRDIIRQSLEDNPRRSSFHMVFHPQVGAGFFGGGGVVGVFNTGADITLSGGSSLIRGESGEPSIHQFSGLLGYRYSHALWRSVDAGSYFPESFHTLRLGLGYQYTNQAYENDFPPNSIWAGLVLGIVPGDRSTVIFSPEVHTTVGGGGRVAFQVGGGPDFSTSYGVGFHFNLGMATYLF